MLFLCKTRTPLNFLCEIQKVFQNQIPKTAIFSRNNSTHSISMAQRLSDKVAIVTASTDGIGLATAERLLQEGAKVVISSRKQDNVNKALDLLKQKGLTNVIGVKCHVGLAEERQALYKAALDNFHKIDILVSNAAVNPVVGSVLDCPEEAWDKIFDINVKATYLLIKEVAPILKQQNTGGSIIIMASIAGLSPFPLLGAYSVSKTALFGLTKAVSQDLANDKIRVNAIAPGVVRTKFASALHESDAAKEMLLATVPLRRLGEPEDISGIVAFLASDDAAYITGETIVAAGGMTSRL